MGPMINVKQSSAGCIQHKDSLCTALLDSYQLSMSSKAVHGVISTKIHSALPCLTPANDQCQAKQCRLYSAQSLHCLA